MDLEPDDSATGGAAKAVAGAAERMRSLPNPGASIDAVARGESAARTGDHPAAREDAGDHPADESTADGDDQPDQPRDEPQDKQPRKLDGASDEDAPPSDKDEDADGKPKTAYQRLLARYGGDKDKAAEAFFENDTKLAKLAKNGKGPEAEAVVDDASADEPVEEEAPADLETAREAVETQVAEDLAEFAKSDSECQTWNELYLENTKRLNELVTFEKRAGQFVPTKGELVTIERKINALQAQIDPKEFGLETGRELDAVEKSDLEEQVKDAKRERRLLLMERTQLIDANEKLKTTWNRRLGERAKEVREHLSSRVQQQRATESDQDAEAAFTKEFTSEFDRNAKGLSKDERANARRSLNAAAADVFESGGDIPKPGPWIERQMKRIRAGLDQQRGRTDKQQARDQERVTRQPAPRGAAAQAESSRPRQGSSRDARMAAERRAASFSRGARA